jgi:hypothetical protein
LTVKAPDVAVKILQVRIVEDEVVRVRSMETPDPVECVVKNNIEESAADDDVLTH